jgi:hypothetical protein
MSGFQVNQERCDGKVHTLKEYLTAPHRQPRRLATIKQFQHLYMVCES